MTSRSRRAKQLAYHLAKWCGGFALARRFTRSSVRIIAYHGFTLEDEDRFRPGLYITEEAFRQRMQYLVRRGYSIIPLADAVRALSDGNVPPDATVITIDDAFYGMWKLAAPVLSDLKIPCTVYVTTYYSFKEMPVFRLVVRYMLWKTTNTTLTLQGLGLPTDDGCVSLVGRSRDLIENELIAHGETALSEHRRVELCRELGRRLGVSYARIVEQRLFSLMNPGEIRRASEAGLDMQLHTHRHRLPTEPSAAKREIDDNRTFLQGLVRTELTHFCYPSGMYSPDHFPVLHSLGIESATTCDLGFNYPGATPLALRRFLDAGTVTWIEFQAEVSGFAELARRLWQRIARGTATTTGPQHTTFE